MWGRQRIRRATKRRRPGVDLARAVRAFEANNPEVAAALRLFDLSMEQYTAALRAEQGMHVYTTASTVPYTQASYGIVEPDS